jgi:hypothetical protein
MQHGAEIIEVSIALEKGIAVMEIREVVLAHSKPVSDE